MCENSDPCLFETSCLFCFWAIPGCALGLLLAPCSGVTPDRTWGTKCDCWGSSKFPQTEGQCRIRSLLSGLARRPVALSHIRRAALAGAVQDRHVHLSICRVLSSPVLGTWPPAEPCLLCRGRWKESKRESSQVACVTAVLRQVCPVAAGCQCLPWHPDRPRLGVMTPVALFAPLTPTHFSFPSVPAE